jgi:hypothetical protein
METLSSAWITYWQAIRVLLALGIVGASLPIPKLRIKMPPVLFALIAAGEIIPTIPLLIPNFSIGNAFLLFLGAPLTYIGLLTKVIWFACASIYLFRLPSGTVHFWFLSSIAAIAIIYSILNLILGVSNLSASQGALPQNLGIYAMFNWLIWLRAYEMRKDFSTTQRTIKNSDEQARLSNR